MDVVMAMSATPLCKATSATVYWSAVSWPCIAPRTIVNFAVESHVDRCNYGPEEFISTNVVRTLSSRNAPRNTWTDHRHNSKRR
jgi:dTDP-D-glucose 4,6-dehydratase